MERMNIQGSEQKRDVAAEEQILHVGKFTAIKRAALGIFRIPGSWTALGEFLHMRVFLGERRDFPKCHSQIFFRN